VTAATSETAPVVLPVGDVSLGVPFNAADWLVGRVARETPERRALTAVDGDDVRTLTYGELDELVTATAAALLAAGIRPEERLLLCMTDTPELVALFLAGLKVGAVPVPVSTMMTGKDLALVALDSRARLLAVSAELAEVGAVASGSPYLSDVVICQGTLPDAPAGLRVRDWDTFLADGAAERARAALPHPTVEDSPGFWLYTSGTTGTPKGAIHRHGSLRVTAETYAREVLGIGPDDVCFSVAKVFFAYGLGNSVTFPFSVGASTVLVRARPTPAAVAEIVRRHRPTLFYAGPTFYAGLLAADLPADAFAGVRLCVSAGEAFPADLLRRFTDRFGVEILDGIGSTEALHIFLSNRAGDVRPGTTGTVVNGYELRLEDDEGQPVPDGSPGNLYVRGESVADGYWCRSETTRRVFRGPWLRTGDTYVRDADGVYTCLGRTGDVLKAGGIWVSPAEVETRLREHPAVAQVAVVSVVDADGLDKPVAVVVPAPGTTPTPDELVAFCRGGLASFKRPRHVLFVDALPQTATGKLQRFRVREFATAQLTGARTTPTQVPAQTPPS
jgi:benzoate-CoA ligase family protein